MTVVGSSRATWRKSSYSGANGNCVEVAAQMPDVTAVRDSEDPDGPQLAFSPRQWKAFTQAVKQTPR